ncbi:hypothetical protein ACHQM5_016372 [Ranunculus cassubicifolius]
MAAVASSLQMSYELGICKNHKHTFRLKQLDASSFRFLDRVNRRSLSLPTKYNAFVCQSSLLPIRAREISILKDASTALSRSYTAIHGNSFVPQLASGLVIIVFAIWGLAPLVRQARNFFFRRSDNSWRRSGSHYVTTSYLQPLLLWTGAILVCRAFDPVVLSSEASQSVKIRLLAFVRSISSVLAFAYCLSSLIQQGQQFFAELNDSSDSNNMGFQFAGKAIYSAVWVAAVSLFMELLGFSTQKMLTAGGLGTVLLTLAGREIFTNFLSSLMIHATRPFVLNEWIQTKIEGYEVSGTVEHVGWWSPTIIRGDDREAVHIPNHKFTVNVVRNLSQKTHWRIKTYFSISHLDVNKLNHIVADMRKVLSKNPQVEQQRLHRRVFLDRIDPENQALVIWVSCFVKTPHFEEYSCVKEAILLDLLRVISHHRARLATPIRTVQKMNSDEDVENIPFSETIFTRYRSSTDRPYLLIEPPYKISSADKSKHQTQSTRTNNEEHDTKDTSTLPEFDDTTTTTTTTPATTTSPQSESKLDSKSSPEVKQETESPPIPTMEDNFILEVALDDSKQTLPIEEEEDVLPASPPPTTETKEVAAIGGEDKKEVLSSK